jgi:hypothetical protein
MSLRRKQSRRIAIDGESYRWTVGKSQKHRTGCVSVVLELAEDPGQRLVVKVPSRDFWLDFGEITAGRRPFAEDTYRPVTPAMIRGVVVSALAAGWHPHEKRKPLDFVWTDSGLTVRRDRR